MHNPDDLAAIMQGQGPPPLHLSTIATAYSALFKQLQAFDPLKVAATFGGLLTVPDVQSNCIRLEILAHLSLASGNGRKTPDAKFISHAFSSLGKAPCGLYEDPAEDMFVTSIGTPRGNFRVLEGIWESAGFFLQRVVNVVEGMPRRGDFDEIRECIYSLLHVSDLVCERAKLARYTLGNPLPAKSLSRKTASVLASLRRLVRFSVKELKAADISIDHLSQFVFDPSVRNRLLDEIVGHSTLERYPLAWRNEEVFFVLPTATSAAIRRFVFERIGAINMREAFLAALAGEYGRLFSQTPMLGGKIGAPIEFRRTNNGLFAGTMITVDRGRYLNCVFFIDTLENFEETGLAGTNPDPTQITDDIDKWIDHAYEAARLRKDFRDGLTVLVGCGIGRAVINYLNNKDRPNWRIQFVSAPDFYTLSWVPHFKPLSLWRMLDAQDKLKSLGVELRNFNGLLNMVAWVRSLEGHLVPHGELPDDFISNDTDAVVAINQNSLRDLRHEVAEIFDPHVEQDVHGRWTNVRKEGESLFEEDRRRPFYAVWERPEGRWFPGVYVTNSRPWWCEIEVTEKTSGHFAYERWKMVAIWLSRAAPVLEQVIDGLPAGPILWKAKFEGDIGKYEGPFQQVAFTEARLQITVNTDPVTNTFYTVASAVYERAHFNVENISERALVDALVEGVAMLAGRSLSEGDRAALVRSIVRNVSARQTHAFRAQRFRDFIQHTLPRSPIIIDENDSAALKLGLGWRVRNRSEGAYIEGKTHCTTFLNNLVNSLEEELCGELRKCDRVTIIELALRNHEAAVIDRDRWRRTAAAVLALHDDKKSTLATMARHDFELNAVFQSARLLVEIALCECPLGGGCAPGRLDFSRLMAKAAMIFHMGGWSDAIRWDAIEPRLRVTPLGDVHAKLDFIDDVISPFSHTTHGVDVSDAIEKYPKNLDDPASQPTVEGVFEAEFLEAWKEEAGVSLDEARVFVDFVEDLGTHADTAVLKVRKSQLLAVNIGGQSLTQEKAEAFVEFLTLKSRPQWRDVPPGFDDKDRQPWRFRRRLSVLRKPLIQVNDIDDPLIVVAPGVLRDALIYMVGNYHRGDFPVWQLQKRMRSWAGKARDARGKAFSKDVAQCLKELGWHVEADIKITKLLSQGFKEDYGDVDVLAWKPKTGRVLIIECKDVQYRKTYGEIAEQLADFRGEVGPDGKPDYLLRHLNRVNLISKHLTAVAQYVGMAAVQQVESHLVFRNPVPMQFALRRMAQRVTVRIFDTLAEI